MQNKVVLYEEYRLIERRESEVPGAWKRAHLMLFFLAFVFGSFCTFCFHELMYMFEEKCVLFPKLLTLTSLRNSILSEVLPSEDEGIIATLPVDFVSTQWVDQSTCFLPTYVPLVSGIFGLVWTTMFLMCTTGSRTLTGLQRPWRVLPPVFVFSLVMGALCSYTSALTHSGLDQLCQKLAEATGTPGCSYSVNVASLMYERSLRGVYQALSLTIVSAWLHTSCWLLSALLTLARVALVVDFQLVRVQAELRGDVDAMLQRHERQIRIVSPASWVKDETTSIQETNPEDASMTRVHFKNKQFNIKPSQSESDYDAGPSHLQIYSRSDGSYLLPSELSLLPEERRKLARTIAAQAVDKEHRFIVKMLYDLIEFGQTRPEEGSSNSSNVSDESSEDKNDFANSFNSIKSRHVRLVEEPKEPAPTTTSEKQDVKDQPKKSNLKTVAIQTESKDTKDSLTEKDVKDEEEGVKKQIDKSTGPDKKEKQD